MHTTRTFEIPACGAALATERTADTTRFFKESEAIFFESYDSLADQLFELLATKNIDVFSIAARGHDRVQSDGRDYATILSSILEDPRVAADQEGR
jgi:spore maturation protein CgeB